MTSDLRQFMILYTICWQNEQPWRAIKWFQAAGSRLLLWGRLIALPVVPPPRIGWRQARYEQNCDTGLAATNALVKCRSLAGVSSLGVPLSACYRDARHRPGDPL